SIPLNSSTSMLSSDNLSPPKIPGTNVEILIYMEQALKNSYTLVYDILPLLPNVDFSLLPMLEDS
ncbi:MAG: hypothetical protein ACFFCW_42545, partial [Candidatus Hodarchaeota archaeon]